jgi:ABC-type polysaccharide transport system permease subunit
MFFLLAPVSALIRGAAWRAVLMAMLCLAALFLYYCCWYSPGAVRRSRIMGLNMTVLLPLNIFWARLLLGKNMRAGFKKAYEVHIFGQGRELSDFMRLFTVDIELAQKTFPGAVFLWESTAPLPLLVRRLIRQGSVKGSAFLKDGGWPVPRFPLTERDLQKGRIKRGAIIA